MFIQIKIDLHAQTQCLNCKSDATCSANFDCNAKFSNIHTHIPTKYTTNASKWKCNVLVCLRINLHSFERIDYLIRLTIVGFTKMAFYSDFFFGRFVKFYCVRWNLIKLIYWFSAKQNKKWVKEKVSSLQFRIFFYPDWKKKTSKVSWSKLAIFNQSNYTKTTGNKHKHYNLMIWTANVHNLLKMIIELIFGIICKMLLWSCDRIPIMIAIIFHCFHENSTKIDFSHIRYAFFFAMQISLVKKIAIIGVSHFTANLKINLDSFVHNLKLERSFSVKSPSALLSTINMNVIYRFLDKTTHTHTQWDILKWCRSCFFGTFCYDIFISFCSIL